MKKISFLVLISFFILPGLINQLKAIPAFARKYNMSCLTCHNPMPRLKEYGATFANNGFRLADQEAKRYFADTGDDQLSLIRDFPLAVRMEAHLTANNSNSGQLDFAVPYLVKLMSGGELSKKLSYYFYFYFNERGAVAGIEDAYIHYNNAFNTQLDFLVGQFSVSDPLFKRELRLTLDDYNIYRVHPGMSNARLNYDRGIIVSYGFKSGTDVVFEVVNGNGLTEADPQKLFDNDNYKNFAGRISQKITDFLRIGAFGYYGQEALVNEEGLNSTNQLFYVGPDMTLSVKDKLELNVQYLYRSDDNLFLASSDTMPTNNVLTQGGFAELIFTPQGDKSKWYMVALGNWIDSDDVTQKYQAATLHFGYLARRNIRLVTEFTYDFTYSSKTYGKGSIGIVAAF